METRDNWNQTPFPVKVEFHVGMACHGKYDEETGRILQLRLEEVIRSNEKWRDTAYDWFVPRPTITGALVTFDLHCPVQKIQPSQLRAFCSYVNRIAQRFAEEEIPGVEFASTKVRFEPCSQIYMTTE